MPIHPKLVHLPIALAVLLPLLTSGLLLAWWRNWLPRRTWLLVPIAQALLVISGFAAMKAGEGDEGRVEHLVPEGVIETHEEAAERFVWTAAALLLVTILPLLLRRTNVALVLGLVATLGSLGVLGLGYRVGESGGGLVYRYGAAAAYANGAGGAGSPLPARGHDDDDR